MEEVVDRAKDSDMRESDTRCPIMRNSTQKPIDILDDILKIQFGVRGF